MNEESKVRLETLPISNREEILMGEIVKYLQKLGGEASKDEIIDEIRQNSELVNEEYIDWTRTSKNGGKYKPSDYNINFSIKNLAMDDFLTRPRRGYLKLTNKGLEVTDFENLGAIAHKNNVPRWDDIRKKNKTKEANKANSPTDEPIDELKDEDDYVEIWRNQLKEALMDMSPQKFESFCRALISKMGVKIDDTIGVSYVADGGLDGFGYITGYDDFRTSHVAIQAKRWKGNVSSPEIDKFRGAMDKQNAEYGIFITTSKFTREAIKASRTGTRVITLIDGDKIVDLVERYKLYIKEVTTYELEDFYRE